MNMGLGEQGEQGGCRLSIAAMKRLDPRAKEIVDGSSHVVVHEFFDNKNVWEQKGAKAALFVYSRNIEPYHYLLIDYFFDTEEAEPLTAQNKIRLDSPLLFYKNEQNRTRCFRFRTVDECNRIGKLIERLSQPIQLNPEPIKNYVGIHAMLASAQKVFDTAVAGNNGFKVAPSNKESKTIPVNRNMESSSSIVKNFFAASQNPNLKSVGSEPVRVGQIEKQQRKIAPREIHNSNPQLSSAPEPLKRFRSEPAVDINSPPFGNSVSATHSTKPKLLLPTILTAKKNSKKQTGNSMVKSTTEPLSSDSVEMNLSVGHSKAEPLTDKQLLQAMLYLIKTDKDFPKKLHEAYLQSFKELLPK